MDHACRREPGRAYAFLDAERTARLFITLITAGELACGPGAHERDAWGRLFQRFDVLCPDSDVAWRYGGTFQHLREQGSLIGANDLWIAATALVHDLPLVTRNEAELRRVPELDVRSY